MHEVAVVIHNLDEVITKKNIVEIIRSQIEELSFLGGSAIKNIRLACKVTQTAVISLPETGAKRRT